MREQLLTGRADITPEAGVIEMICFNVYAGLALSQDFATSFMIDCTVAV